MCRREVTDIHSGLGSEVQVVGREEGRDRELRSTHSDCWFHYIGVWKCPLERVRAASGLM